VFGDNHKGQLATIIFPYLKQAETIRKRMWESALADGHRPTDKEVVQIVEYGRDTGDRGVEGGNGRKDGAKVLAGSTPAKRDENGAPLADTDRFVRKSVARYSGAVPH
jgi:hypothetical protein